MTAPKLSIDPHWVAQTLVPYLRYAFRHVLRSNTNITPYVERAVDFCLTKPDYPTDAEDLLFERIFIAIEHRHNGIPADLIGLTNNLEPLAKFLIRRAQLKGSFELLDRDCHPGEAWKNHESGSVGELQRQGGISAQQDEAQLIAPNQSNTTISPSKIGTIEALIDPRLLFAQQGQYTTPGLSGSMTVAEDQYYRQQNQELKQYQARGPAHEPWREQPQLPASYNASGRASAFHSNTGYPQQVQQHHTSAMPVQKILPAYDGAGRSSQYHQLAQQQQQQAPAYIQHLGRRQLPAHIPPLRKQHMPAPTAHMYIPIQPQPQFSHPPPPQVYQPSNQTQPQQPANYSALQPKSINLPSQNTRSSNSCLPILTNPAGITEAGATTGNGAQRHAEPLPREAFLKLSREEKCRRILELADLNRLRAAEEAKAQHNRAPRQQPLVSPATLAFNAVTRKGMVTPPNSPQLMGQGMGQAISVPAPGHQTQQVSVYATMSLPAQGGGGGFMNHPGYSNIMSAFPAPQFHGLPHS
ncbi:hypothetical protein EJ02DRAFT_438276 [Clathrospora elynae]|uniref:Uncharacterized protein n=1 Tax=Clathrospora elynae TaxID=706981 RepID=A0A6A5SAZ5_9PLEO|nr:hypothetical protein EJ02DRAFT_438276 [Clathrospora elynae]